MNAPQNLTWHHAIASADDRARVFGQHPATVWLTGLSGSGKSTLAYALEKRLLEMGKFAYVLDGDNVRHGLNRDLGFGHADRTENIRRIAEVAHLMNEAGLIVISAFISPYRADRDAARQIVGAARFVEIHMATPIATCEARDPKGLYVRARRGELADFTGVSAPYEVPETPQLRIDATACSPDDATDLVVGHLRPRFLDYF